MVFENGCFGMISSKKWVSERISFTAWLGRTETLSLVFEGKKGSEWNKAVCKMQHDGNVIPGTSSCTECKRRYFIYIKMLLEVIPTCLKNNSWKTALS